MKYLFRPCRTNSFKHLRHISRLFSGSIILLLLVFQTARAQESLLEKRLDLDFRQSSIPDALSKISDLADCTFSYSSSSLPTGKLVTLQRTGITLSAAIREIFGNALEKLEVQGNKILIVLKKADGSIKGTVKTIDGQPAEFVTVGIKGIAGTTVDEKGNYILKKVPDGTYTIFASFVGLNTQSRQVEVNANHATEVNFILSESGQQLQEVVVKANRHNRFAEKESENIARLPIKNLENPQVYNVVGQVIMKEQMITDYASATQNVAGMVPLYRSYSNGYQSFIRGFAPKTFLNGLTAPQGESIDPVNIERIEVLKGPSGTLFGSGAFGGLINNVTKRPMESAGGEVSFSTGSWGLSRLTLDYNLPLNTDKTLLFRINAARHREKTFQDFGFKNSETVAPSLEYHPNDKLSLFLDATFYHQNSSMWQWASFGPDVTIKNIKDLKIPYNRSFAGDQMQQDWGSSAINALAKYKLSKNWVSSTNFVQTIYLRKESFYMNGNQWLNDSTLSRYIMAARPQNIGYYQFQQNFTGDFKIGRLRNRLVAGLDFYAADLNSTFVRSYTDVLVMNDPAAVVNVPREKILKAIGSQPALHTTSRSYTYGAYFSDVINVTDQLLAMASLRIDRFDNKNSVTDGIESPDAYKQTALSPKLGLVYQIIKDKVSVFGNYMNSFQNNAPQDNAGQPIMFKPSQANQWEGGIKAQTWDDKLSFTLSYYDISVKNALRADPSVPYSIQDGTQYSRGIEAEIFLTPIPGFNITAGYGYNKSRYEKAEGALEGKSLGAPENIANLWLSYSLLNGPAKGLGLGIGGNYVGDIYASDPILIPSYKLLNSTVFYDRPKYRIGLKVNNMTNEKYWSFGFINPQPPRNYVASISYKF